MYILYRIKKSIKFLIYGLWRDIGIFFVFLAEYLRFRKRSGERFSIRLRDLYPCLEDRTVNTPFDQHYIYHPAWAARVLAQTRPEKHIDISSILSFSTTMSAFVPMEFYDYRPADVQLSALHCGKADLLQLPFGDNSVQSISCMHTIEHVGLGRYGDPLDPDGDLKAIRELKRVVAPGGDLLFVTPVGKPAIHFNAHRVYGYAQIMEYFEGMELKDFSLVPDTGGLINAATKEQADAQRFGCGCFWFKKSN